MSCFAAFFSVSSSAARSELDAARAYNKAARSLHGSAAKLNLLPESAAAPQEPAGTAAEAAATLEEAAAEAAAATERSAVAAALASIELEAAEAAKAATGASATSESRGKGRSSKSELSGIVKEDTGKETAINGRGVGSLSETPATVSSTPVEAEAEMSTARAEVVVDAGSSCASTAAPATATDWGHPGELDFRDLEEIPEAKGTPLWDIDPELESAWATVVESETRGIDGGGSAARGDDAAAAADGESARASSIITSDSMSSTAEPQTLKMGGGAVNGSLSAEISGLAQTGRDGADTEAAPVTTAARKAHGAPAEGVAAGDILPGDDNLSARPLPTPVDGTGVGVTNTSRATEAASMDSVVPVRVEAAVGGGDRREIAAPSPTITSTTEASPQGVSPQEPTPPPPLPPPPSPPTALARGIDVSASASTSATAAAPVVAAVSNLDSTLPAPLPPRLVDLEKEAGLTGRVAAATAADDAETLVVAGEASSALRTEPPPLPASSTAGTTAKVASDAAAGRNGAGPDGGGGGVETVGVGGGEGGDGGGGGEVPEGWGVGGVAGWERDEMGEELYEERLRALVRCATGSSEMCDIGVRWGNPTLRGFGSVFLWSSERSFFPWFCYFTIFSSPLAK